MHRFDFASLTCMLIQNGVNFVRKWSANSLFKLCKCQKKFWLFFKPKLTGTWVRDIQIGQFNFQLIHEPWRLRGEVFEGLEVCSAGGPRAVYPPVSQINTPDQVLFVHPFVRPFIFYHPLPYGCFIFHDSASPGGAFYYGSRTMGKKGRGDNRGKLSVMVLNLSEAHPRVRLCVDIEKKREQK